MHHPLFTRIEHPLPTTLPVCARRRAQAAKKAHENAEARRAAAVAAEVEAAARARPLLPLLSDAALLELLRRLDYAALDNLRCTDTRLAALVRATTREAGWRQQPMNMQALRHCSFT